MLRPKAVGYNLRCLTVSLFVRLTPAALLVVLLSCSSTAAAAQCEPVETSPDFADIHLLPGAAYDYEFSPPASGPHLAAVPDTGVHAEAIIEPLQVSALEQGNFIIQYSDDVDESQRDELGALAEDYDNLIIAPANSPIDRGQPVAVTAWGHRQLCDGIDIVSLRAFISDHPLEGDEH